MRSTTLTSLAVAGLAALSAVASGSAQAGNSNSNGNKDIESTPRVIGGRPATSSEFKFIAFLQSYNPDIGAFSCTGSLIAPNVVMTAGHCMYASNTVRFTASQIQVGFTHQRPPQDTLYQAHSVSRIILHPSFSMLTQKNDIALLILADSISTTEATPAKVYTGGISTKTPITAAGFGVTDPHNDSSVPTQLMTVDLAVGSNSFCRSVWPDYSSTTLVCTDGTAGKDTCQGDSGGPLVTPIDSSGNVAILGVTSFGPATDDNPEALCAQAGGSGYYTRVRAYAKWIADSTGLNLADFSTSNSVVSGGDDDEDASSSSTRSRITASDDDDDSSTRMSTPAGGEFDFSGFDFSGFDFSGFDFTGFDFSGFDFSGFDFSALSLPTDLAFLTESDSSATVGANFKTGLSVAAFGSALAVLAQFI
ncbi:hypothetical protein H4217_008240 [Coemansia sp. RSA 1939]|nr:hypothetical protein H4217_008240 [Coemansia sp. RSA 1939]KAJ2595212.1 hypothetical protein EV177_008188 [Coemansia sp. RSA 1804]KAJ2692001.1 hypothetical protein GGH99_002019 [Coemansia sp. RSA 1285]